MPSYDPNFNTYTNTDTSYNISWEQMMGTFKQIQRQHIENSIVYRGNMMSRVSIPGMGSYDPSNISGKQLVEIGRATLHGKIIVDMNEKERSKAEGQVIDKAWLDSRVEEICKKGRL